ncbi:MAG: glycolate oxidase subunit GlcE [Rhodocyclaceae bacterium]|nr:glycolate oxidase subunit GlcE [Rhodocyclaceae bacterium]
MDAFIRSVQERILAAHSSKSPVVIHGGNTKSFYGAKSTGEAIDVRGYAGVIDYQPRELVLTVRAGTPLAEIESLMDQEGQILPFEPPHFSAGATIGGTVATGLSGPRRAYAGAVRDFVLGTRIINGKGEDLRFGGRVIKNVAGYDVSRLMVGALGTLGVLLDLSFKVLPKPASEVTLRFEMDESSAIRRLNEWAGQPLPLSASWWLDGVAMVRLSGTNAGVAAAKQKLGGEQVSHTEAAEVWRSVRDHQHPFFQTAEQTSTPLWRLSVPATTSMLALGSKQLHEWGGALRWLAADVDADALRAKIAAVGGHATLMYKRGSMARAFHPLEGKLAELNRNLKVAFDPANVLNRGRLDNVLI